MATIFQLHQVILFLTISIGLWLAFWVYFAGKTKKTNKYFFWMVLLWLTGEIVPYFLFRNVLLSQKILFFLPKLEIAFVFIFFIFFYLFSINFLKETNKFPLLNKLIPCTAIVGAFLSIFTNLFLERVELTEERMGLNLILTPGGKIIWLGFVIIITLFILSRFLLNYFRTLRENKLRFQYFLIGVFIWAIINLVFNVYFPIIYNTFRYAYFGNYVIFVFFGFTAYAIVKRELFGIKVVLTALLVGLIAILLFLDAVLFTQTLGIQILKGIILVIFLFFGYSLIKSVLREIKLREELGIAYQELKKLDEAKMEFLSIASHQLRTPLTVIKGYLSMILDGDYGKIPEKVQEKMKDVYLSSERLIKLVNDLLSATRIETGKMELKLKKAPIEPIIEQAIKELEIKVKEKNLYLRFEKPPKESKLPTGQAKKQLPEMLIDSEKIKEAIYNIIDNSIRYTQKGGITIKCKMQNSKCKIEVSDTGTGLTEDELSKLFESFSRGAVGSRLYSEGVGLGLYIARKFIEMHNGTIRAESEGKGKGSSFCIELAMK